MSLYIGIDPGASGAVAWIDDAGPASIGAGVFDLPTIKPKRGRTELVSSKLAHALRTLEVDAGQPPSLVLLEHVELLPRDGRAGILTGGINWGRIEATLATLGYPLELVRARAWKRELGLTGDKARSITMACGLFPALSEHITGRKGADRAEALLLAVMAKRRSEGDR